ncbi:hypothetical protein LSH36_106g02029 [Paralvinella palmiformis]|uniref:Aminopeptidase n=1 Tax=Paralvinella palmiformis TaxID=53620 RepID=A0AAD9K165_9ANNE|nr:hypothetical protein LSH36_106g02029 [Paralvinella palmiformis]
MSTYLVAFVVCDYKAVTATTEDGKNVSIYAPADLIDEASLAIDVAPKILSFYEDFYNIPYPLAKSDHIAVPDFAAGAMENWGLITYRMRALLVNDETASPFDKQWVVIVIAHELAHQWFGNLVTMTWWNDLWLNEGFASFMEYKGADFVRPEWHMWDQFLLSGTWLAFSHDGLRSSHPISVNVTNPKEIEEIFDSITYNKGAALIRMCVFFLGEQVFRDGLELYLNRYKFSNAETKDLWVALSEKSAHIDVDVSKVMDTWTAQMGYPVVTVERHGNTISAKQERFLYNPRGRATEAYTSPYNYTWYIPLSYMTSDTGYSTYEMAWMNRGPATIMLDGNPSWVKVNINVTSLYCVHYKGAMWDNLVEQLQTDHTVFSAADRASLIKDAFALTRSGHLPISKALDLTTYLTKETDYVVWSTAYGVFSFIKELMEDKGDYHYLQNYLLSLIENQLTTNLWQPVDDHLQTFLQSLILSEAFHLQHQESITHALQLFQDWMNNSITPPPALKSLIFYVGAKYGGSVEWEYLWKQYENPDNSLEKKIYLRAMTATTDSVRIMRLLDWSLDPEKVRTADTVSVFQYLASNRGAQVLTWNFVKQNWNTIFTRYKDLAFQMKHLIDITKYFTSEYFYNEVKSFFEENLKGQDRRSVNQALENIEMNIDWLKNNQKDLVDWLKKHPINQ